MEKNFLLYLINIGLIDESSILPLLKSSNKSNNTNNTNNKIFTNSSFYYLMNYFDNLTEEQKKYMSFYIPAKYKLNLDEKKRNKLKSLFIRLKLRQKLIILKNLYLWKRNIKIFKYNFNSRYISQNNKTSKTIFNKNRNKEDIYPKKIGNNKINHRYKNNNNINIDFEINKNEYSIENIDNINNSNDNKIEVESINKLQQISQNTTSLDDIFSKNPKYNENKSYKKNKEHISNIKNSYNLNSINIKSYNFKNNDRINKIKSKSNYRNYTNIIKYKDFRSKSKESSKKNNSKEKSNKKSNIISSLEEKEMEALKECTFKPNINNRRSGKKRNILSGGKTTSNLLTKKDIQSTFEKLYNDNEKYKLSKELKTIDHEYFLGKNISFTPNISSNNTNFRKSYSTKSEKNFQERQKEYLMKKDKKNEELKHILNTNYEKLYSFNPKITNDKGEYYQLKNEKKIPTSVFQRLYQDYKNRKDSQEQKEIENINKFNDMSNLKSQKKTFNYDHFEKLKENNKEEVINKLREKLDKEKGITFKPLIEEDDYIKNVDGNFFERNENWIIKRNIFIEDEKIKQMENMKNNVGMKEYTKDEKKEIINNIINRLYYKQNATDKSKEE